MVTWTLAGCGRLGFDANASSTSDASGDSVLSTCAASPMLGIDLSNVGSTVQDVAVARQPDGYAIGFLMDATSGLWGMHLDPQLVPTTQMPYHTTPVGDGGYTKASMSWTGTTLVGSVENPGNTIYLKTFAADMTTFTTASQRNGFHGEPSVASTAGVAISTWFDGAKLFFTDLLADGQPSGTDTILAAAPAQIMTASAASGSGAMRVAFGTADGACLIGFVTSSFDHGSSPLATTCVNPHLIAVDGQWVVAYQHGAEVVTRTVTMAATGPEVVIGPGKDPRLFTGRGGEVLVAFRDGPALQIARAATGERLAMPGLPATVDAYETTESTVFVTAGTSAYAGGCP